MPEPMSGVTTNTIALERLEDVPANIGWGDAMPSVESTSYYYKDGTAWQRYSGEWTSTWNNMLIKSLERRGDAETIGNVTYITSPKVRDRLRAKNVTESDIQKAAQKLAQAMVLWVRAPQWSGSGTIVEMEDVLPGYIPTSDSKHVYGIITNNHVAPPEVKELMIKFGDGSLKKVSVIKGLKGTGLQDEIVDVALLIVESDKELPTVKIAQDPPKMGDVVLAAGHSLGLPNLVVTVGHVTQPSQLTGDNLAAIQADAAINPGNSGGGLFRVNGDGEPELIGTNTYTFRDGENVTFAIPISKQLEALRAIYSNGEFVRGYFGFEVKEINPFDIDGGVPQGAEIAWLDRGSPADTAGLNTRDIITAIKPEDGSKYKPNLVNQYQTTEFIEWMHKRVPGEKLTVSVARPEVLDGKTIYKKFDVELEVAKLMEQTSLTDEEWGFTATRTDKGIVLSDVEPGSPADEALTKAKLKPGKLYLIGLESSALSEKGAVEARSLEELKKMLIYLRRGEISELTLLVRPAKSKEVARITLRREVPEVPDAVAFKAFETGTGMYVN